VDKDNPHPKSPAPSSDAQAAPGKGAERTAAARHSEIEALYRRLEPELRRTKPNPEAIAAALEAAQRLADEVDAEPAAEDVAAELTGELSTEKCQVCGHHNRPGIKFCAQCGGPMGWSDEPDAGLAADEPFPPPLSLPPNPFRNEVLKPPSAAGRSAGMETHHYHHHYHHHYFPAGHESGSPRGPASEPLREEKMRPNAALRGDMSRAEAGVRRITHEWALACNTKHLDDLMELYASDALLLRSNHPPVRGAAAIREFFFVALDAGLGDLELEPLRVEVMGDLAYEAGRFKALVPSASGKRREERGKYLWVCARQNNGEWKLTADCWSSDLSFGILESDAPASGGVKTSQPKKS